LTNLHAQLAGKRLLVFSTRQIESLSDLVLTFGASVLQFIALADVLKVLGGQNIDGALLD
jgi:hypothetical protein